MEESQDTLVASLRAENEALKLRLALQAPLTQNAKAVQPALEWEGCGLTGPQVSRYSRQLVLPSFGPQGMLLDISAQRFGANLRAKHILSSCLQDLKCHHLFGMEQSMHGTRLNHRALCKVRAGMQQICELQHVRACSMSSCQSQMPILPSKAKVSCRFAHPPEWVGWQNGSSRMAMQS